MGRNDGLGSGLCRVVARLRGLACSCHDGRRLFFEVLLYGRGQGRGIAGIELAGNGWLAHFPHRASLPLPRA